MHDRALPSVTVDVGRWPTRRISLPGPNVVLSDLTELAGAGSSRLLDDGV